jgi:hypothetical protein
LSFIAVRIMADLPDINCFSEENTRALSACVLRTATLTAHHPGSQEKIPSSTKSGILSEDPLSSNQQDRDYPTSQ